MNGSDAAIRCRSCAGVFHPDLDAPGVWICRNCRGKNPNLRRHFRSLADLCAIGLAATGIYVLLRLRACGPGDWGVALGAANAALLAVAVGLLHQLKTPWTSHMVRIFVAAAFVTALVVHEILPGLAGAGLNLPGLAVFAIVFAYLLWLNTQAIRCTA